ncbi:hypothetical protein OMCYN_01685 [cyanobiont of Ornithocercus magnificus]|nr:hypothetical protein OMCYN_01685 [cyanobiont of Ornithocercus magnificus]
MAEHSRFYMTLNEKERETFLEELAREETISSTEIVRRAVNAYIVLKDQQKQKKRIMFVADDGSESCEFLFI